MNSGAAANFAIAGISVFSKIVVSNKVVLNGALNVSLVSGYSPPVGSQFRIISSAQLAGAFVALNVPQGISVNYSNTGVYLTVTSTVPAQIVSPRLSDSDFAFSFSTLRDQSYTVLTSTNIAATNWTVYTNIVGAGTLQQIFVPAVNTPYRFFRLREP